MSDLDFSELIREAQELGIQYNGNNAEELNAFIVMARSEQGSDHPVACYGRSYDPSDRRCRICQLKNPCADLDKRPRIELCEVGQLNPIPCDVCRSGSLEVECVDQETRELRDYACTTPGCQNSVSVQCGWDRGEAEAIKEIVIVEKKARKEGSDLQVIEGEKDKPKRGRPSKKKAAKKVAAKKVAAKKVAAKKPGRPKKEEVVKKKAAKKIVKNVPCGKKRGRPPKNKDDIIKMPEPEKKNGLQFLYNGVKYPSLIQVVKAITQSNNWNVLRFFGMRPEMAQEGQILEREYEGCVHTVEVVR